jgi:NAD-dependent DNA ligase
MSVKLRVKAKSDPEQYRTITIWHDGARVDCNCDGFNGSFCSHIDAVLVAQESAMVHGDDQRLATQAIEIVQGRIEVPQDWKGSWRKDFHWRGLPSRGGVRVERDFSKPLVCFTGTLSRERSLLSSEAVEHGWEVINSPSPHTTALVAADPRGMTKKLKYARSKGTPIVSEEEWKSLMSGGELPN